VLLAESKEMAWIATEGNAFNHATDRVADVGAVADRQRQLGRPIKAEVEVSKSGRVRQTAFQAAMVERLFLDDHGSLVAHVVPGSFHEFITRDEESPGVLDLRFDSSNATAIFKMTRSREPRLRRVRSSADDRRPSRRHLRPPARDGGVLTSPEDRARFEKGWRYGARHGALRGAPASTAEVAAVLRLCNEHGCVWCRRAPTPASSPRRRRTRAAPWWC
jgi:hypothetical protein